MTMTSVGAASMGGTFVAALLLLGNSRQAEQAMIDGIQSMACDGDELLSQTLISALGQRQSFTREDPPPALPVELRRVLRLAPELRRCFVLRILLALPSERCAGLLRIEPQRVDEAACAAVRELARIANPSIG